MKPFMTFILTGLTSTFFFGQSFLLEQQLKKSNILRITEYLASDSLWIAITEYGNDSLITRQCNGYGCRNSWKYHYRISDTTSIIYYCEDNSTMCSLLNYSYSENGNLTSKRHFSKHDTLHPSTVYSDYVRGKHNRIIAYSIYRYYPGRTIVELHKIINKRKEKVISDYCLTQNGFLVVDKYKYTRKHFMKERLSYKIKLPDKKSIFSRFHKKREIGIHVKYKNDKNGNWIKSYYVNGIRKRLRSYRNIEYRS